MKDGSTTLLSRGFTSLSAAQKFFADDPLSLGTLSGNVDLTISYKLTATAPEGAGISYVLADHAGTATVAKAATQPAAIREPRFHGVLVPSLLAGINAELASLSARAGGREFSPVRLRLNANYARKILSAAASERIGRR